MITERSMGDVPTPALYALHRGIEKRTGLITGTLSDWKGGVCSIGSLLEDVPHCEFNSYLVTLGLKMEPGRCARAQIEILNDVFNGTPEERREYMLRLIVEELHHRGKSLSNKSDQAPKILTHEIG